MCAYDSLPARRDLGCDWRKGGHSRRPRGSDAALRPGRGADAPKGSSGPGAVLHPRPRSGQSGPAFRATGRAQPAPAARGAAEPQDADPGRRGAFGGAEGSAGDATPFSVSVYQAQRCEGLFRGFDAAAPFVNNDPSDIRYDIVIGDSACPAHHGRGAVFWLVLTACASASTNSASTIARCVSVKSPVSCRLKLSMLRRLRNSARASPIGPNAPQRTGLNHAPAGELPKGKIRL